MNAPSRIFVVDRFEGRSVVLVPDEGDTDVVMPRKQLTIPVEEGTVLRVPLKDGMPDWKHVRSDPAERARRLGEMRRRTDRLLADDPGGDLDL